MILSYNELFSVKLREPPFDNVWNCLSIDFKKDYEHYKNKTAPFKLYK